MANRILAFLQFYRLFIIWSIIINLVLVWLNSHYLPAILTKLFLTGFAWYFMNETTNKRQFTFYKNIGIRPVSLFAFVFVIDSIFTIVFLHVFKP